MPKKKTLRVKTLLGRKSCKVYPCVVTVKPADLAKTVEFSHGMVHNSTPVYCNNPASLRPKTARPTSSHKTLPSIASTSQPRRVCMKQNTKHRITPKDNTLLVAPSQKRFASCDVSLSQEQLCESYFIDVRPRTGGGYAYHIIFAPARKQHWTRSLTPSSMDSLLSPSISFESLCLDLPDDNQLLISRISNEESAVSEGKSTIWSSESEDSSDGISISNGDSVSSGESEKSEAETISLKSLRASQQVSTQFTQLAVTSQPIEIEPVKVEKVNFFTITKPPLHPSARRRTYELNKKHRCNY